jgi:hypothetical protein
MKKIFVYIVLAAVVAASFNVPYSIEALALFVCINAIDFYYILSRVFVGIAGSTLNVGADIQKMLGFLFVNATAVSFVYVSEYSQIAYIAIPWISILLYTNILVLLVRLNVIGIKNSDEDE